ncbi:hypothetical protein [Thermomonospora cellulosilytica]|uniref:Uncharacterized protein n=1 Tax=Thermomonospora cellulosilytica TaxID=1411118 RepID=A0A7W3N5K6_9ACTN|nr:hypothetical protein [Thermomonospora cellulosilytica]MBA9007958.1 hypothetical protein [Thermomonospora cellulosilytica]
MTVLAVAWTHAGALALAAADEAGLLPGGRRVLLAGADTPVPELRPGPSGSAGFAAIARRFDTVIDLVEELAPLHPAAWAPPQEELPLFERLLRRAWDLGGGPVRLVVESVSEGTGRTLASIFHDAPITVCCPGLAAYGPTMHHLPDGAGSRIERMLHLDLVPGLPTLLHAEYGIPVGVVPPEAYRAVVQGVRDAAGGTQVVPEGAALVIGDRVDPDREVVRNVIAGGHTTVVYVAPPPAPPGKVQRLAEEATRLGGRLVVAAAPAVPLLPERPALVTGSASPADLFVADRMYGLPVAAGDTGKVLGRLGGYESTERVPLTIADAALPALGPGGAQTAPRVDGPGELAPLLSAITYCMRMTLWSQLREPTRDYVKTTDPTLVDRYFDKERLQELALVDPPSHESATRSDESSRSNAPLTRRIKRKLVGGR